MQEACTDLINTNLTKTSMGDAIVKFNTSIDETAKGIYKKHCEDYLRHLDNPTDEIGIKKSQLVTDALNNLDTNNFDKVMELSKNQELKVRRDSWLIKLLKGLAVIFTAGSLCSRMFGDQTTAGSKFIQEIKKIQNNIASVIECKEKLALIHTQAADKSDNSNNSLD